MPDGVCSPLRREGAEAPDCNPLVVRRRFGQHVPVGVKGLGGGRQGVAAIPTRVKPGGHLSKPRFSTAQDVRTVAGGDDAYPPWPLLLIRLPRLSGSIGRFECFLARGHNQKRTRKGSVYSPPAQRSVPAVTPGASRRAPKNRSDTR